MDQEPTGGNSGAGHGAPVRRHLARAQRRPRSRLVIHLDQGVNCFRGPISLPKLRVLSAWIPAVWSPLKRVSVLGQPAASAAAGEPNHKPRWNVWIGSVAGFADASGNGG